MIRSRLFLFSFPQLRKVRLVGFLFVFVDDLAVILPRKQFDDMIHERRILDQYRTDHMRSEQIIKAIAFIFVVFQIDIAEFVVEQRIFLSSLYQSGLVDKTDDIADRYEGSHLRYTVSHLC